MNPPSEQLIRDYLNRMSVAARRKLGFRDRQALLDRMRMRIEVECGGLGTASAAQVRKALAGLGDPVAVVECEHARIASGSEVLAGHGSVVPAWPSASAARAQQFPDAPGPSGRLGPAGADRAPAGGESGVGDAPGRPGVPLVPKPAVSPEATERGRGPALGSAAGPGPVPEPAQSPGPVPEAVHSFGSAAEPAPGRGSVPEPAQSPGPMPGPTADPGPMPAPTEGPATGPEPAEGRGSSSEPAQSSGPLPAPGGSHRLEHTSPMTPVGSGSGRRGARRLRTGSRAGRLWQVADGAAVLARRNPLEVIALGLLGVGGAAFPPVWLLGAGLATASKAWDLRDKWIGLVLPVLLVIGGAVLALILGGKHASLGSYAFEAWLIAGRVSRGAAVLGAGYLLWRLQRGPREPRQPPWNVPHRLG